MPKRGRGWRLIVSLINCITCTLLFFDDFKIKKKLLNLDRRIWLRFLLKLKAEQVLIPAYYLTRQQKFFAIRFPFKIIGIHVLLKSDRPFLY